MKAVIRLFASKQFVVFLLVGGTAALVNFFSGALVRAYWTSYPAYVAGVTLGFVLGTVVSFILNRRFTFKTSDQAMTSEAFRFAVVALGAVLVSVAVASVVLWTWELVDRVLVTRAQVETLGHICAIGLCTVYNFLAMKFFAFRRIT